MCRKAVLRDKLCWFDCRINHCLIICMSFPIYAKGGRSRPVFPPAGAQASALAFAAERHLLVTVSTLVLISALIWRRPLLSVWSVPHRLGTLATQRLWMFIIQSGWRGGDTHKYEYVLTRTNRKKLWGVWRYWDSTVCHWNTIKDLHLQAVAFSGGHSQSAASIYPIF